MSETTAEPLEVIELPHNAWYDEETDIVSFSLGMVTFNLEPSDFFTFAESIEDISTVLAQMTTVEEAKCPTCGSEGVTIDIAPIPEEDFH
jgi:hypothetical protein